MLLGGGDSAAIADWEREEPERIVDLVRMKAYTYEMAEWQGKGRSDSG